MLDNATFVLLILSLALTSLGYGFKQSIFKLASIPFWLGLGVYIAYNFTWFGAGQWAFTLLGFMVGIPILLNVLHREAQKTTPEHDLDDEEYFDSIDEENNKAYKFYRQKTPKPRKHNKRGLGVLR